MLGVVVVVVVVVELVVVVVDVVLDVVVSVQEANKVDTGVDVINVDVSSPDKGITVVLMIEEWVFKNVQRPGTRKWLAEPEPKVHVLTLRYLEWYESA